MGEIEALAERKMDLFRRNNCPVGGTISPQMYLSFHLLLNQREQELEQQAKEWLAEEERAYITVEETPAFPNRGVPTLRLTQHGFDRIY
jgi:hypothetical protein